MKLSAYRSLTQSFQRAKKFARNVKRSFMRQSLAPGRANASKRISTAKTAEEKEKKSYARPYIDYLDQKERELFEELWQNIRFPMLAHFAENASLLPEPWQTLSRIALSSMNDWAQLRKASLPVNEIQLVQWLKTMRSYRELERPLWGSYRILRGKRGRQTERDLAAAFYPIGGFGFSRCHAYQSAAPMGSIFKLVTANAAMRQSNFAASLPVLFDEIRFDEKTTPSSSQHRSTVNLSIAITKAEGCPAATCRISAKSISSERSNNRATPILPFSPAIISPIPRI